jgi:hypothetical protein
MESIMTGMNFELYGMVFVALLKAGKTDFQEQADFFWGDMERVRTGEVPSTKVLEQSDSASLIYKVYGENDIFSNDLYFKKNPDGSLELSYKDSDLDMGED